MCLIVKSSGLEKTFFSTNAQVTIRVKRWNNFRHTSEIHLFLRNTMSKLICCNASITVCQGREILFPIVRRLYSAPLRERGRGRVGLTRVNFSCPNRLQPTVCAGREAREGERGCKQVNNKEARQRPCRGARHTHIFTVCDVVGQGHAYSQSSLSA